MLVPICIDRTSKPPLGTPLRSDGHWSVQGLLPGSLALNEGAGKTAFDVRNLTSGSLAGSANLTPQGVNFPRTTVGYVTLPEIIPFGSVGTMVVGFNWQRDANRMLYDGLTASYRNVMYVGATGGIGVLVNGVVLSDPLPDTTSAFPSGVDTQFACSWGHTSGPGQVIYEKDRVIGATSSVVGSVTSGLTLGTRYNKLLADNMQGTIYYVFLYNIALSSDQIASLSANPWQLYEPETVWVEVGGVEMPVNYGASLMMGM